MVAVRWYLIRHKECFIISIQVRSLADFSKSNSSSRVQLAATFALTVTLTKVVVTVSGYNVSACLGDTCIVSNENFAGGFQHVGSAMSRACWTSLDGVCGSRDRGGMHMVIKEPPPLG